MGWRPVQHRGVALALAMATVAGCGARDVGNGSKSVEVLPVARVASPPEDFLNQGPGVAYVGDATCARCHAAIARSYHTSRMSRSWRDAGPGAWAGATTPATVDDPASGYRYRIEERERRLSQTETSLDPHSDRKHELSRSARYLVGSGGNSFALVSEENGYLFELPVGHFASDGAWRLNPGYERKNQRFDRQITSACVSCHGGVPNGPPGIAERFKSSIGQGISCERCHGPGQLHVDLRTRPAFGTIEAVDRTIVNPAHLSPSRSLDVCLQCHLQGDVHLYPPGRDAFSFRPGRPLSEHRLDFLVRSERNEEMGIASHGTRLMKSRCFTANAARGGLTCVTCHDPHVPVESVTRAHFVSRCLTCHKDDSCHHAGKTAAPIGPRQDDCISCHMPRRKTREGAHLVSTDHWISPRSGRDEADSRSYVTRLAPDCDPELVPLWPEADPGRSALGEAYIRLHEVYAPQLPSVQRGMRLLEAATRRGPADTRILSALAVADSALGEGREAVKRLQRVLEREPADHEARLRLAIAYEQAKLDPEAIAEYQRLLDAIPDWLEPYPRLVRLLLKRNDIDQAASQLERQLALHPDPTALVGTAVVQFLRGKPASEARRWIDRALELDPQHPMARRLQVEMGGR